MNPYPGLRPFDGEFAQYFFGRDRQIAELIDRLRSNRFVAVVGLSGSGKSSLVRGGLLPALRAGQLGQAGSGWLVATMRPTEQPVATLVAELNKVLGPMEGRAEALKSSTLGLLEGTRDGRSRETNLLVFVDQFEDVFRLVDEGKLDAQTAAHFINLLLAVSAEPRPEYPFYAVITVRSEYLGSCARYSGLPETLNRSQYLVPRLTPDQLREAIEAPAALTEVEIEAGLVQRLLVEASIAPDELPRLQHLLMRLWAHRNGAAITLDQYWQPEIGGLEHSLNLHADEVYSSLTIAQKGIAQRIFQRLTTWDEANRDARRPTSILELAAVSEVSREAVAEVVGRFRAAHFLTVIPGAGADDALLDITHESLIRYWNRLEGWAKQERRYRDIYLALSGQNRPLWSDAEVREAIHWRDKRQPTEAWAQRYAAGRLGMALDTLTRLELDLTAAARRGRRLAIGIIVVGLVLAALSGWALFERWRAEKLRQESLGRHLAAESVALLSTSVDSSVLATLLAVESMERGPLLENHAALRQTTSLMAKPVSRLVHQNMVRAVAFSHGGRWVATGSEDNTARVMEAVNGTELWHLTHGGAVNSVAFSPNDKWVATGSRDHIARVVEAVTGKEVSRLKHQDTVRAVSFSPDGKWVATGSDDKTARVMNAATGDEVLSLNHGGVVNAAVFSPDGKRIVTASGDHTARVIDVATKREVFRFQHGDIVRTVVFSPDGKWIATGSDDYFARVFNSSTGVEVSRVAHHGAVYALAFSPDGERLATGSFDSIARVFDRKTGIELSRLVHQERVGAVVFSPDGRWVATGSSDNTARVMEASTGREVARLPHEGPVTAVAFSPDSKWVATGSQDHTARVLEATTGKEVTRLTHQGFVTGLAFSRDGKLVVTGSYDKEARVLETTTGRQVSQLTHGGQVYATDFSPDGRLVATGSKDKKCRVWGTATGQELTQLAHDGFVYAVAFSADGKFVATGSEDKFARVMDAMTGIEVSRMLHQNRVTSVAFSPDGRWVATTSDDHSVRLMESMTGKEAWRVDYSAPVYPVTFSPDGKLIATASANTVRVIELASRKEVSHLVHQATVFTVAFSGSGKLLATGGVDKTARVMDVTTGNELVRHRFEGPVRRVIFRGESALLVGARTSDDDIEISELSIDTNQLIEDACSRLPRNLTRKEWNYYLHGEPYHDTCPKLFLEPSGK